MPRNFARPNSPHHQFFCLEFTYSAFWTGYVDSHYVMDEAGHWTQVTRFEDAIVSAKVGQESSLYLLSRKNAPRGQILRLPLSQPKLSEAKVVVPQSSGSGSDEIARASIEDFVAAGDRLYVIDILGGPSRVRVFSPQGRQLAAPPVLPRCSAA